ncbi:P-loop containing nucleoside triphosphate hydrolase protein [Punctularia strigosozonata HHB-11173 SS5]|uniref:P-loop containing nucleoside triphosphate hydrolase protein n=1 Tax=Punctularia strigosozonata (strain HHB-11173) TaxID=741275 RepID=UPI00044176CB|nr:P-loop containing nucleoside triphosphate hydrolase protein [Punctularia strigosozonata HHB-11173 SS5]EIN09827.1 P-loop containing nucleoside triphosphate hydrolase protein [Punctularia strigosozonata HHB-11173 SS5]
MRLQALQPPIPSELVDALDACEIRTDHDLLFGASTADIIRRSPPGTISYQALQALRASIQKSASAAGARGSDLLIADQARRATCTFPFTFGVEVLDELLRSLETACVVELSGDKGTGKSLVALHLILQLLCRNPQASALWVDTTGDFAAEEVSDIIAGFDSEAKATAAQRLQVTLAFDVEAAHDVLDTLQQLISSERMPGEHIRIVVIDSITPLLGPGLSAVSSQGHAVMITFMRQLRSLARSLSASILIVNSASSARANYVIPASIPNNKKPALGPSFTFTTDTSVWLTKRDGADGQDAGLFTIEILRSRTSRSRIWSAFRVVQGRVVPSESA